MTFNRGKDKVELRLTYVIEVLAVLEVLELLFHELSIFVVYYFISILPYIFSLSIRTKSHNISLSLLQKMT